MIFFFLSSSHLWTAKDTLIKDWLLECIYHYLFIEILHRQVRTFPYDPRMQSPEGEITFCLPSHKNKLALRCTFPVYSSLVSC